MALEIRPLSPVTWPDFVALFDADAQCRDCWCLNHRVPAAQACTGVAAQAQMRALVDESAVGGLLAYEDGVCCAWASVDPLATLPGHDCHAADSAGEWSIHCLFVAPAFRSRGVSRVLIEAALRHAAAHGATLVSAFPIPPESAGRFPKDEAEFSGRHSTFTRLGFVEDGTSHEFYRRMTRRAGS